VALDIGRCKPFACSLELPGDLDIDEWRPIGTQLKKLDTRVSWWLGDGWAFGEARYRDRKARVEAEDWDGPAYQTCRNAATISRSFEASRRRDTLSYSHHAELAALEPEEADDLLDWVEETIAITGKPRSARELRGAAPAPLVGGKI
jgi:hypothetical protein